MLPLHASMFDHLYPSGEFKVNSHANYGLNEKFVHIDIGEVLYYTNWLELKRNALKIWIVNDFEFRQGCLIMDGHFPLFRPVSHGEREPWE